MKILGTFLNQIKKSGILYLKAVEKSLQLVGKVYEIKGIQIVFEKSEDVIIKSYENEFAQALINIFYNAKDALEKVEGEKFVFIDLKADDNFLYLSIKDNAKGIDETIIKNIFEPYFTTKHQSQGTGIGLYMTQMIIEKHMKGSIEAKNSKYTYNKQSYIGAEFIIKLPL